MTKRERLEDLGEIKCMLSDVLDSPMFEYSKSKHDFELWAKKNELSIEDDEECPIYEIFCSIIHIKHCLWNIYSIACGDTDD